MSARQDTWASQSPNRLQRTSRQASSSSSTCQRTDQPCAQHPSNTMSHRLHETSAHPNSRPPSGRRCPPSGFQELPPEPSCPQVLRLPHSPQHVRQPRSGGGPNPHLNSTASETDCKTKKAHPTTHATQLIASDKSCDPNFLCPLKVEHLVCAVSLGVRSKDACSYYPNLRNRLPYPAATAALSKWARTGHPSSSRKH